MAFPVLAQSDFELIQGLRREHDPFSLAAIDPHFTLARPRDDLDAEGLATLLLERMRDVEPFRFVLRRAVAIAPTGSGDYSFVFLEPEEGRASFLKLHQRIGAGVFLPHVTVGSPRNFEQSVRLADELNRRGLFISGRVDSLDVVVESGDVLARAHRFQLKAQTTWPAAEPEAQAHW